MTAPAPAQRVRSALVAAASFDVVWDEDAQTVHGAPWVGDDGDLLLPATPGTPLGDRLRRAEEEGGHVGVYVTLTDLAPLAVRDRVRGRVALAGRAEPGEGPAGTARVRPQEVRWQPPARPDGRPRPAVAVDAGDYREAGPDPLAGDEADLLLAVAATPGLVAGLSSHLPACVVVDPARPPVPVRLDRDGVVLRVDGPARAVDARLAFGHDAVTPALAWAALEELLARV